MYAVYFAIVCGSFISRAVASLLKVISLALFEIRFLASSLMFCGFSDFMVTYYVVFYDISVDFT
jgi:hypothetical protein